MKRLTPLLFVFLTACQGLPIPILIFATPGPSPVPLPAGPTAPPPAMGLVSFAVRIPANTPAGSPPVVRLLDMVSGTATTVPLVSSGNNVWTGGAQAVVGALLRYRYARTAPAYAEELTPAREAAPYRLAVMTGRTLILEDSVAAWEDTPFAGDTGHLAGVVRNSNTGQGVAGAIVSAGGQISLSAWDGSFTFFGLPVGSQRVTAVAPDGSLRPAQVNAVVSKDQTAGVEISTPDPNQVHVTFIARLPAGSDGGAALRLAGNVLAAGDTFVAGASGSSVAAARQPVLVPMADGRWTATLLLYEGTVLEYKYTLGDGAWNGELDSNGSPRLRRYVVPWNDSAVEDTVSAWHAGRSASVSFAATVPAGTPPNDILSIQFRTGNAWNPPAPMWRTSINQWRFVLYNPTDINGSVFYRYCRNFACGAADDADTAGFAASGRYFTPTLLPQELQDTISAWQWLADMSPAAGLLPPIPGRPGFAAGVDFPDRAGPNDLPFVLETVRGLPRLGAGWVTFTPRSAQVRLSPLPAYADGLEGYTFPADWREVIGQAHNLGLKAALHPVTCPYTPYGACAYWNQAAYSPAFWDAWFNAYEKYIVTQARLARQSAADLLIIGDFKLRPSFPGEPEAPADAEARWRKIIGTVRQHYGGALGFELLMGESVWPAPPAFLDSVDAVRLFWWSPLAAGPVATVPDMTATAGAFLDTHVLPVQQRFGKPIHLNVAYYSADGAATQCLKRDDGQCHSFEDFNPGGQDVLRFPLDLQEQADAYTAVLTAVAARPWVAGFSTYGYNPVVSLRDKSLSVRGKPAEAVLSAWYPALQGR